MFQRSPGRPAPPLKTAIAIALIAFFVSACGDSNNFDQVSGNTNNPTPVYAGRYLGANNLGAGQTSVLDVTVADNGNASGTLEVSNLPVAAQGFTIAPGLYNVIGNVNLNTGTLTLSGTLPGLGAFSITGALPLGNLQSTYNLIVNGQTFNGVMQNFNQGIPTPPGGGGGNGGGTDKAIFGGTLSNFQFTAGPNYNGVNPPVNGNSLISGAVRTGSATENSATISLSDSVLSQSGVQIRAFVVSVITRNGEPLEVGRTYNLADTSGQGAIISLSESTGTVVNRAWTLDPNTTGSITITSLTATNIEMDFQFTAVGPNSEVTNNQGTGSFSTSGHLVGTFAQAL